MMLELLLNAGVFTTLLVFIVTLFATYGWIQRSKLPPGPFPYPLIGNILTMRTGKPNEVYRRLRAKYGDVFTLHLGRQIFIVFNGYDTLKNAFIKQSDVFSDRPDWIFRFRGKGIIANSGESWKQTRTYTLNALRQFGFGRKSLESRILEEVEVFIDSIAKKNGQLFDVSEFIFTSVSNVICSIVFGFRFEHNDERFQQLLKTLHFLVRLQRPAILMVFPFLRKFPGNFFGQNRAKKSLEILLTFCKEQYDQHLLTYDDSKEAGDLIDVFIREGNAHSENAVFSAENLVVTAMNLFNAGTETTSTTIRWSILYMIHFPKIQDKLRQDIENVVGSRPVKMEDKPDLPYVEAFIIEVLRCGNIVPFSLPHGTSHDTIFNGYVIPKKAVLTLNLDSVLCDAKEFPNPEQFNPSRFIGKDGKVCGHEKVITFSIGRRQCLGEALAKMELFLFISMLIQRFKFLPESRDVLPSLDAISGTVRSPMPYKFKALKVN